MKTETKNEFVANADLAKQSTIGSGIRERQVMAFRKPIPADVKLGNKNDSSTWALV
jgi:hypothetical protein